MLKWLNFTEQVAGCLSIIKHGLWQANGWKCESVKVAGCLSIIKYGLWQANGWKCESVKVAGCLSNIKHWLWQASKGWKCLLPFYPIIWSNSQVCNYLPDLCDLVKWM